MLPKLVVETKKTKKTQAKKKIDFFFLGTTFELHFPQVLTSKEGPAHTGARRAGGGNNWAHTGGAAKPNGRHMLSCRYERPCPNRFHARRLARPNCMSAPRKGSGNVGVCWVCAVGQLIFGVFSRLSPNRRNFPNLMRRRPFPCMRRGKKKTNLYFSRTSTKPFHIIHQYVLFNFI
jgi:hypothetical protein